MYVWRIALVLILAKQIDDRLLNVLIHAREIGLRVHATQLANLVIVIRVLVLSWFASQAPFVLALYLVQSNPHLQFALFSLFFNHLLSLRHRVVPLGLFVNFALRMVLLLIVGRHLLRWLNPSVLVVAHRLLLLAFLLRKKQLSLFFVLLLTE